MQARPTLKPGDRVDYFEGPGADPAPGVVRSVIGRAWVGLELDDGRAVDQAFVTTSRHQSPLGGNCIPHQ